jgi:hypothetical protein
MRRKIKWTVQLHDGQTFDTEAATPESAANKVLGSMYSMHWEAAESVLPEWYGDLSKLPVATSEKGKFLLFHMDHG